MSKITIDSELSFRVTDEYEDIMIAEKVGDYVGVSAFRRTGEVTRKKMRS